MRRSGFSLLELMVVIAIIVVMGLAAMPGLSSTVNERTIYGVGVQLQQDIRLIQQYSISQRSAYPTYRIDFTVDGSSHAISYVVTLGTKTRSRIVPSGVAVSLNDLTSRLGFDSFGRPLHDGGVALTSGVTTILLSNASGSKQVSLVVGSVLGRVSLTWLTR